MKSLQSWKWFIVYVPAMSLWAIPYQAQAEQTTSMPETDLGTIIVTATRSDRALNDAPVPVQVLSSKTLQDNNARTLKEALELLPNVQLRPVHGKTGYEVVMQGFDGDRVLVLIDGLPITASTGSTVNLNQYLNTDVQQIEVIQGAASAQYGSAAMGGVINVITKPISNKKARINVEVGSNAEQNPSGKELDANRRFVEASLEGALDKQQRFKARLSGSYLDDAGLTLNPNEWPRIKDASTQSQVTAKLSFTPDATPTSSKYWLEASHYQEEDERRYNRFIPPKLVKQHKDETITKKRISVGGQTQITSPFASSSTDSSQNFKLSGSAMHEIFDSESIVLTQGIANPVQTRDTQITTSLAQAQLDLPVWQMTDNQTHLIQVGGQWQQDKLNQIKDNANELSVDDASRDAGEVYIQDDWFIGDGLEVLTGVRYQKDTDFGGHTAPKISVKYNHSDDDGHSHIWRASVGSGYRVPNLKERYYVFDHSAFGYKVLGNPDLTPETSVSYQLGYQGQLSDKLNLSVNGFYNDFENFITTAPPVYEDKVMVFQYINANKGKTYGGDIGLDWQLNDRTNLHTTYAYTKTYDEKTDSAIKLIPEHKASVSLNQKLGDKFRLISRVNYEGKQLVDETKQTYSPAWWTWDSKLNYYATDNLTVYGGVNNLFDVQRDVTDSNDNRPVDNRQWLVGASYDW